MVMVLANLTPQRVNLNGLVVKGDNGESFEVSEDVYIESYGYVVFAARLNSLDNGGITQVDYAYSVNDLRLNSADTIRIEKADTTLLDEVIYDVDAFPFLRGASISLGTLDSTSNDEFRRRSLTE